MASDGAAEMNSEQKAAGSSPVRDVLIFIGVLWVVFWIGFFVPIQRYGIRPRQLQGLVGILTSPFIHANLQHIAANSAGLLIFGIFCALLEGERVFEIIAGVAVMGGLLTWVFGRNANHIGASGVIFGLFGYLTFVGLFNRKWNFILASLTCLILFGSTVYGILPKYPGVSWESHLFGFLSGAIIAKWRDKI